MATKRKAGQVLSMNAMFKRYGAGLASDICLPEEKLLWLPSRIPALNDHLGGGIQYGNILELFGEESTGKTLLAIDFGTVCQSLGGIVCWADAEGTFGGPWAKSNGLDLNRMFLLPEENSVEVISDWLADAVVTARNQLVNNEPILLIIDSIASLDTKDNIENSQEDSKAEMGKRASEIDKLLRRRNKLLRKYGVCTICINQLRQKVGASKFEDPDVTPGGKAMKFYASQRIGLYKGKTIKDSSNKKIGHFLYIRTKKNKLAAPKESVKLQVYFKEQDDGSMGYHKYAGLPEVLLNSGVVKRKRGIWYFKGNIIAKSDDKMVKVLVEDEDLRRRLIKKSGINTVSKTRQRIESIEENRYPVKIKKSKQESNGEEE